jgi:hypothetical protein
VFTMGKVLATLGDILKMQGWTQLPPGPRPLILGTPPPRGLYPTLNGVEHTTQSLRWPGTLTTIDLKGCNNEGVLVNLQLVIFCEVLCKILELPIDVCRLSSFSVDLKYYSTLATSTLIILLSEMLKFLNFLFLIFFF